MDRQDRSIIGMNVGAVAGSQAFLIFTLAAQPGHWLFPAMDAGHAMALYGYCGMLSCIVAGFVGYHVAVRLPNNNGEGDE